MIKRKGEHNKMVKLYLKTMFVALVFIFALTGCSGAKSESKVQEDIEQHSLWQSLHVQTTDFHIEKRQTNAEQKEDIIYIAMKGENERCMVERYYIATYHLYNEGWLLDSLVENYDETHFNKVIPIKGADVEKVQELVNSISIWDYSSFESTSSDGGSYEASVDNEPVGIELLLEENYGRDTYAIECTYYYGIINETLKLPLVFEFQYIDSETGYDWVGYVDEGSADRTVEFSDGILGEWVDSYWDSPFYAKTTFSELQGKSCRCDFSSFTYNGSIYINGKKDYSGQVTLNYDLDSNTGRIEDLVIRFNSDRGEFEISSSGDRFTMQEWGNAGGYVTAHRPLVFER